MDSNLARAMYDAYAKAAEQLRKRIHAEHGAGLGGAPPDWDDLVPEVQECWRLAGHAARQHIIGTVN